MLSGYNNDVVYRGMTFHVQTEEGGRDRPYVRTILFYQGNVLASEQDSYEALLQVEGLDGRVRKMMQEQHRRLIRRLLRGEFEEQLQALGAAGETPTPATPAVASHPAAPAKEKPKAAARPKSDPSLDEQILEFLKRSPAKGPRDDG